MDRKINHEAILQYNRTAWNRQVEAGNRWTIPVSPDRIAAARNGDWEIVLTPGKPVPRDWFPDFSSRPIHVLCLAGGGGQQGPILAAAGARVTVVDNSDAQLQQDRTVARREGLFVETIQSDMSNLSALQDHQFDLIIHPCSIAFVENVIPVWQEAFRVLQPGGCLLSGFTNPLRYIFDDELLERGELVVRHAIPYSDLNSIDERLQQKYAAKNEPYNFGHSLSDLIGGQLLAGFHITGFYEDRYDSEDVLSRYIDSFAATRGIKPT